MKATGKRFRDAVWLLVAQTIGAFNDNAAKAMLPALAALVIGKEEMDPVNQQVSLMLIVPFVLFGPFAGWLSDRFSKRKVTSMALFAQVLGLVILCIGMGLEFFYLSLAGFFLLATQSAMLSPAKKGILKELVGSEKLGMAVGWMEMLTMVGILSGAFAGARAFDALVESEGGWRAGLWVSASIGVLALVSWMIFQPTPEVEPRSKKPFRFKVLFSHFQDLGHLWKEKPLRLAALGDAWFWAFGTFFYLVLVKLAGEVVEGDVGMASHYGLWFLLLGLGIMIGSLLAAYVNRGQVDLGLVPLGTILMPLMLFALTRLNPLDFEFRLCCVGLGAGGAFLFVPLNAFLQDKAGEERRGRVVAASNLLTNILTIGFIGVHAYLSNVLELEAKEEILVLVVPSVALAIYVVAILPEAFFRTLASIVTRTLYRVEVSGSGNVPRKGGVLILCNHLSYADPVLVGAHIFREVQFLAYLGLANSRLMRFFFRLSSTIPLSPTRAKDAIRTASTRLKDGETICIFPEGGISRFGPMIGFRKGFELIARKGDAVVLPVYLDGVWGSIFSFSGGRFFRKWPRKLPYPVRLQIGEPIPSGNAGAERLKMVLHGLSRKAFSRRAEINRPLAEAIRTALLRGGDSPLFLNGGEVKCTHREFLLKLEDFSHHQAKMDDKSAEPEEAVLQLASSVLKGEEVRTEAVVWPAPELLASIMRISETNLWNEPSFKVQLEGSLDSPWDQTWLLWAPILGGFMVSDNNDGTVTLSLKTDFNISKLKTYVGFALPALGVVTLNLPDLPKDVEKDGNRGSSEGSYGRLLPGLEARLLALDSAEELPSGGTGQLEFVGVTGEWIRADRSGRFDEDGFLWIS